MSKFATALIVALVLPSAAFAAEGATFRTANDPHFATQHEFNHVNSRPAPQHAQFAEPRAEIAPSQFDWAARGGN